MNATSAIMGSSRTYDGSQPAAQSGSAMGKDEFLKLLVAQMSNQDPLNPAQGTEYVAQLAQFSSVEQLISLNSSIGGQGASLAQIVRGLGGLGEGQDALLQHLQGAGGSALMGATGLIGKSVEALGGRTMLEDGHGSFDVRLSSPAASGTLTIRDAEGNVVRRIEVEALGEGAQRLDWDGRNESGEKLPDGPYTATFAAKDADGKSIKAEAFTRGEITRVGMTATGLTAWIGGIAVPVGALTSVSS